MKNKIDKQSQLTLVPGITKHKQLMKDKYFQIRYPLI